MKLLGTGLMLVIHSHERVCVYLIKHAECMCKWKIIRGSYFPFMEAKFVESI